MGAMQGKSQGSYGARVSPTVVNFQNATEFITRIFWIVFDSK